MPYDITALDVAQTLRCSADVRAAVTARPSVETAARAVCGCFYDGFTDRDGQRASVLVRFYVSIRYASLPAEDQEFVRRVLPPGVKPWPDLRCLALLGTRGEIAAWNSRHLSQAHRAIPLPSVAVVEEAPMIAQLFKQMGASIADIVGPAPRMLAPSKKSYNVFHVPNAKGSPHIPAQADFVERHGVRSVVGFGGLLPWGELFAVILFSRAPIDAQSASRFRTLALDVRAAFRGFTESQVFEPTPERDGVTVSGTNVVPAAIELTRSSIGATIRTFQDTQGVEWKVWAIIPSITELESLAARRRTARYTNDESWQKGWLLFESSGESRRLRPIPDNWGTATPPDLDAMCRQAKPVRSLSAE